MQNTKFIASLLASAVILPLFTIGGENTATAQRPVSLLRAKCVNSGLGSAREEDMNVSIGRGVYSSRFYLGPGYRSAAITCKIQPDNNQPIFQTLNLGFGMRDNDNRSASVNVVIYVDGKQVETRTISPSKQADVTIDVTNAANVAIEANCSSEKEYCDRVYFYNASLQRPAKQQPAPAEKK
ncbi:NPCBM/NEW2 domain-containing protein [Calothrix sp. PCC 6303]|uniref:NPCBM/NEW2 domain-containing protein n=1 Tax=Calothrix sp. PCC 6303 TaxID=1170562 RepID=UPI0002A02482|nr:NPCBM/NEW2 domain-containing protein [Calothrix sp. PCC 6303]AFZ02965.1 hypothetical protein Cal6303_4049 [Calothrix sp. PCC 6303]